MNGELAFRENSEISETSLHPPHYRVGTSQRFYLPNEEQAKTSNSQRFHPLWAGEIRLSDQVLLVHAAAKVLEYTPYCCEEQGGVFYLIRKWTPYSP